MSDCCEIYIRNKNRIEKLNNDALDDANKRMEELDITMVNLPDFFEESGAQATVGYDYMG